VTHSLPPNPNISLLKKQAKKLLKRYRERSANALASVNALHPKPAKFTGLRDAQLVVARSYGFTDWTELSNAVIAINDASRTPDELADLFIQLGCVQYSGNDTLRNYQRANNLLTEYPRIAEHSFYTALVATNLDAVTRHLSLNPTLATDVGGPLNWPALLYCSYSRIDDASQFRHSLKIAKLLLDNGANPNSFVLLQDTYRFTALTGAMGEGEQGANQPPHQYSDELAELLLDAGADVNEGQGLYNTMFTTSVDKWLAVLIDKGLNTTSKLNWKANDKDANLTTLNYQLAIAVDQGELCRVQRLLDAGANACTTNSYSGKCIHSHALLKAYDSIASLLEKFGAKPESLCVADQFRVACARSNYTDIALLLNQNPQLLTDASLLHDAAKLPGSDVYHKLIELGFDLDGQSNHGRTILHHFVLKNDVDEVAYLIGKGARIDIRDSSHNSTAVGFAAYSGSDEVLKMLLDHSNSFLDCVSCAYLERAMFLLEEKPERILDRSPLGNTALHVVGLWLHEEPEYEICNTFVDRLVAAGADIHALNSEQQSPVQFYQSKGADNMADLLIERGG